jgi:hypothetical protein
MKLEQSFEITATAPEIESRVITFMKRNGYQQNFVSKMTFMRGSRFGSYLSFSPRKWQTRAIVAQNQIDQSRWYLTLTFEINDDGQLVTQHERGYWKAELDDFQRAIQTGETTAEALARQDRVLVSTGAKGYLIFLAVGMIVATLTSLLIAYINPQYGRWAMIIGAFFGVTAGLIAAKRHWGF